jgi:chromosome segregation ATPase
MNGNPQRLPQNAASPPNRNAATALPPGSPTGLLPNVTASLRGILLHNHNALTQAISQLEAAGDIQNELVTARAAHAQISRDLITALDQNVNQGLQLQQAQNDLTLVTQKLQGAREQLKLLESKLASADGQASARHATQGAHSNVRGYFGQPGDELTRSYRNLLRH